jgi:hypothetical protein
MKGTDRIGQVRQSKFGLQKGGCLFHLFVVDNFQFKHRCRPAHFVQVAIGRKHQNVIPVGARHGERDECLEIAANDAGGAFRRDV